MLSCWNLHVLGFGHACRLSLCLLFESLLQIASSIYFLYSSLAIFINDLYNLYLFVFLMSEPVSLIELSKVVSLCTLVSKKKYGCVLSLYVC